MILLSSRTIPNPPRGEYFHSQGHTFGYSEGGGPGLVQNVETDGAVLTDVGVVDLRREPHLY